MTSNAKIFVRCKDCKRNAWVHLLATEQNGRTTYTHEGTGYTQIGDDKRRLIQLAYTVAVASSPKCQDHIRTAHTVDGTYNPDRTCNARCTGAVGPACSCSCGGENHGGGFGSW